MIDTNLIYLSLAEAAQLIEKREVSPLDLTDACIARAQALDATLHAYLTMTFETARQEAKAAGDEIAAGSYRGPLHGIPFAIKDLYETAGVVSTAGSQLREHYVPAEDARTVELLKQAGIVMLGKLNLHEWAMGGTNVNEYYPTPTNPWDMERVTGGSSGGSGAALAAGYCYGSLGSDTRGSIRIPAALNGITGIKPTWGRVSIRGVVPLNWSLDHAGPMARTAEDCALILNVIAGYDERDPTSADRPVPDYAASLAPQRLDGVRVGLPRNFFFDLGIVDPIMASTTKAAGDVLASLGAEVVDIDFPGDVDFQQSSAFFAEASWYHESQFRDHPEMYGKTIQERMRANSGITGVDYVRDRWRQLEVQQAVRGLMRDIDLILTPTSPIIAPKIAEVDTSIPGGTILARNTSPFNIAAIPTISMPAGFSEEGQPIGVQLSGRWWEEGLVLRAAHAYQQVTDWHMRRPPL
ncbi:MAG TPA: amidase [Dehalococcoidia bacterium]|nr:amidase [Dehalococcoidia bacterium]